MATIRAKIPEDLALEINKLIELGLYKNEAEVIKIALRKLFAKRSREYLRTLAKDANITEKEMLAEWRKKRR